MFEEYRDRVGELITGIVQQTDSRYTLVQLRERVEALLPKSEQVDGERYDHYQRVKAVIKEVSPSTKGPSIIVSRRDPELIKKLFELEVPEIADGLVEIANVAREPGYRSKIAVVSHADGVDPVGACVGPRGSRVRMVVSELRGEKIDIIPYNDEPARFVAKALSPGPRARGARRRRGPPGDRHRARRPALAGHRPRGPERPPRRPPDRLAHRHQVRDRVRRDGDRRRRGRRGRAGEPAAAARRSASRGRRCPNAALPGSPFCGLPQHQALVALRRPRRSSSSSRSATRTIAELVRSGQGRRRTSSDIVDRAERGSTSRRPPPPRRRSSTRTRAIAEPRASSQAEDAADAPARRRRGGPEPTPVTPTEPARRGRRGRRRGADADASKRRPRTGSRSPRRGAGVVARPHRRCIGCGDGPRQGGAHCASRCDRRPRRASTRRATLPGRGAYVCGPACAELARPAPRLRSRLPARRRPSIRLRRIAGT